YLNLSYAQKPAPLIAALEQSLSQIEANQESMIHNQLKTNMTVSANVNGPSLDYLQNQANYSENYNSLANSLTGIMSDSSNAIGTDVLAETNNSKTSQNSFLNPYIKQLPNNNYLTNLIQGKPFQGNLEPILITKIAESPQNNMADLKYSLPNEQALSLQSAVIASEVVSKMNSNEKINQKLFDEVKAQLNSSWFKSVKSASRDQILRDISLQLSVSNLLNYQKLQAENLNALLKTAELMDNNALMSKIDNLQNTLTRSLASGDGSSETSLYTQVKNINSQLSDINNNLISLKKRS
ncbi:hypothetical protein, partial [Piscirickettsia litoralis]